MTDHRSGDERGARAMSNPEPPDAPGPDEYWNLHPTWDWGPVVNLPPLTRATDYYRRHGHDLWATCHCEETP